MVRFLLYQSFDLSPVIVARFGAATASVGSVSMSSISCAIERVRLMSAQCMAHKAKTPSTLSHTRTVQGSPWGIKTTQAAAANVTHART